MKGVDAKKDADENKPEITYMCACSLTKCNADEVESDENGGKVITVNIFLLISMLAFK